jgi:hypothetical protein
VIPPRHKHGRQRAHSEHPHHWGSAAPPANRPGHLPRLQPAVRLQVQSRESRHQKSSRVSGIPQLLARGPRAAPESAEISHRAPRDHSLHGVRQGGRGGAAAAEWLDQADDQEAHGRVHGRPGALHVRQLCAQFDGGGRDRWVICYGPFI